MTFLKSLHVQNFLSCVEDMIIASKNYVYVLRLKDLTVCVLITFFEESQQHSAKLMSFMLKI